MKQNHKPKPKGHSRKDHVTRRNFLATAGVAALAATSTSALAAEARGDRTLKILGVSCSPRKGMTTANAVQAALDAAKAADPRIQTELIDLGGLNIAGYSPKPPEDDMKEILPKFQDSALGGVIIGSPGYFRSLSGLARCFFERLAPLREPTMVLADKPSGVVAVGAFRNGGQELTRNTQSMRAGACFLSRVRGQYFGTERSISLDHAVMPPFTLFTRVKPCSRRNWSAFMERPPDLQNR